MRPLSNLLALVLLVASLAIGAGPAAAVDYLIEVQASGPGTVSPSPNVVVPAGGSQTFTFTPSGCNGVLDVTVDDVSVGSGLTEYTFTNVQSDHVLYVSFGPHLQHTTTILDVRPVIGQCAAPETLRAAVPNVPDGGEVQFFKDAILLGTRTLTSGIATFFVSGGLPSGSFVFSAKYLGTACFDPSTSSEVSYEVIDTGPLAWTLHLSIFNTACNPLSGLCDPGDEIQWYSAGLGVTTTLGIGPGPASSQSGQVTYYDGDSVLAIAPLVGGTSNQGTPSLITLGVHVISAVAQPTSCVATVTASPETLVVVDDGLRYDSKMTLTISPNPDDGGEVVLTAAPRNDGGGIDPQNIHGVVDFLDQTVGVVVGRAPVINGTASFTYGPVSGFSRILQAQYEGDYNVLPCTSNEAILQIGAQAPPAPPASPFSSPIGYDTGPDPHAIASADFNADGNPDLATVNWSTKKLSVLLGSGDGAFASHSDFGNGAFEPTTAIGDLNGDGRVDLAVTSEGGVSVLLGNGDGTFGPETRFGNGCNSVAIGDLNADGRPDLVTTSYAYDRVSVLLGNGDGTFGTQTNFFAGRRPWTVAIANLNPDGQPDLAVLNHGNKESLDPRGYPKDSSYVSILLGNGDGTFGPRNGFACGQDPTSVGIADLNNDGRLDLVTTNTGLFNVGWTVSVLLGNGDGTFQPHDDFIAGLSPLSVGIGDIDGDGQLDLAVAGKEFVSMLLGRGDGTFRPKTAVGPGGSSVTMADFNGDGRLDLAVSGSDRAPGTVAVLLQGDVPVATLLAQFDASSGADGIELRWSFGDPSGVASVAVERAPATVGPWLAIAPELRDESGVTVALDRTAESGSYFYRLVVQLTGGGQTTFGPVSASQREAPLKTDLKLVSANPTSSGVQVQYSVARAGRVRLEVLDVSGRVEETLADRTHTPGRYAVTWDGVGRRGRYSPGLYFVRLVAPDLVTTRKLAIIP